jgi:hypothetical protein
MTTILFSVIIERLLSKATLSFSCPVSNWARGSVLVFIIGLFVHSICFHVFFLLAYPLANLVWRLLPVCLYVTLSVCQPVFLSTLPVSCCHICCPARSLSHISDSHLAKTLLRSRVSCEVKTGPAAAEWSAVPLLSCSPAVAKRRVARLLRSEVWPSCYRAGCCYGPHFTPKRVGHTSICNSGSHFTPQRVGHSCCGKKCGSAAAEWSVAQLLWSKVWPSCCGMKCGPAAAEWSVVWPHFSPQQLVRHTSFPSSWSATLYSTTAELRNEVWPSCCGLKCGPAAADWNVAQLLRSKVWTGCCGVKCGPAAADIIYIYIFIRYALHYLNCSKLSF